MGCFRLPYERLPSSESKNRVCEVAFASVSWIPKEMWGLQLLPETDSNANWGDVTTYPELISSEGLDLKIYRFTNILAVRIVVGTDHNPPVISKAEYLSSDASVP